MWELIMYGSMATGASSFGVVCFSMLYGRHKERRYDLVASQSALRLKAYYSLGNNGPNPYAERDKHGYLVELEWAAVAELEHELGFTHTEEAEKVCNAKACWKENQNPEYTMLNGFLTMNEIRSLSQETLIIDPQLKKDERTGRYIPRTTPLREVAEVTPYGDRGEDGPRGEDAATFDDMTFGEVIDNLQMQIMKNEMLAKEILSKENADTEELFQLAINAMKDYNGSGMMVVPEGVEVTPLYKHGDPEPFRTIIHHRKDGYVQVEHAQDQVVVMTPAQARALGYLPGQPPTESDRRRDACTCASLGRDRCNRHPQLRIRSVP